MKNLNILIIYILISSFLLAGTDGTVRGIVRDVNGEPLPGVQVYIEELGQGATTDGEGNYIILNIQVGTYEVKAAMIGYSTQRLLDVGVIMDQTQWLNIVMMEEAIEGEEIVVSGEKKLVEAGTTSKKITINQEAIEALPIKDVSELYSLQSGVVKIESGMRGAIPDQEERGLEEVHVRGGRTGEIAYMIDGMYIRNPIYGGKGTGTRLNLFAVEEFDWQPGGFNSEYGDAMSAVSNIHTAFGKDKFRYKFKYETSLVGDKVFDNDQDNTFFAKIPSHSTIDMKLGYERGDFDVDFSVNNLLNKEYFETGTANSLLFDAAHTRFNASPMPERNFSFTIRYKFN